MSTRCVAGIIVTLLLGIVVGYFFGYDHGFEKAAVPAVASFEECVQAGNPVMESYPEQCRTKDGHTFTREITSGLPINTPPESEEVFCPADAKQCPDGSYVGRQGPACDFAPCPGR